MKRKLIMALMSCFLLGTTLITTTYAWFTMNRVVGVNGLELNVYSGDGVLVSITGGNSNYVQNLGNDEIKKAIVAKYKELSFDSSGNLYRIVGGAIYTLDQSEIDEAFNEIILDPITSVDGVNFTNIEGTEVTPSYGAYVSFDLFFKTSGSSGGASSEGVDLYFYSDDTEKELEDGTIIKPTTITSATTSVQLENHMNYYDKLTGSTLALGSTGSGVSTVFDPITVNPKDAIRFSTYADTGSGSVEKIYELSEGLGSYATDITDSNYNVGASSGSAYLAKYDSSKNAAYTYFNNVNTRQEINALSYDDVVSGPLNTIKDFNVDENAKICRITNVEYETKVTFAFWLEGYDADCFDGIGKDSNITVTLSFTTVYRESLAARTVRFITDTTDSLGNPVSYVVTHENSIMNKPVSPITPTNTGRKFMGWSLRSTEVVLYDQTATLSDLLNSTISDATPNILELYAVYE